MLLPRVWEATTSQVRSYVRILLAHLRLTKAGASLLAFLRTPARDLVSFFLSESIVGTHSGADSRIRLDAGTTLSRGTREVGCRHCKPSYIARSGAVSKCPYCHRRPHDDPPEDKDKKDALELRLDKLEKQV